MIVVAIGWTLVSVLVALAFGGMTRGGEVSSADVADVTDLADVTGIKGAASRMGGPESATPPHRDDEYRTAV